MAGETLKILVICQHYWPEPYPLNDTCEELVRRGHEVHVVTDIPNYPMGEVYSGYEPFKAMEEVHNGVKISRVFTIARKKDVLHRILNYESYSRAACHFVKKLRGDYDVVYTNQTSPIMMSKAALVYGKKWQKKVVLYAMDLWPASLAAGGIKPTSPIYKFYQKVSRRIYQGADRILMTSSMFRKYFTQELGIREEKLVYHPQYAEHQFDDIPDLRKKDEIHLVFAGNVGSAQGLDVILEAAEILSKDLSIEVPIFWDIVGDGSQLQNLKENAKSKNLANVIFHGRKPKEEMPAYYGMADAMLVTLAKDPVISLTLPGKVQTYMAARKPILGSADGEIPQVIEAARCGWASPAGDSEAFAKIVKTFLDTRDKNRLGERARRYYLDHFTRETFMDELEKELYQQAGKEK